MLTNCYHCSLERTANTVCPGSVSMQKMFSLPSSLLQRNLFFAFMQASGL